MSSPSGPTLPSAPGRSTLTPPDLPAAGPFTWLALAWLLGTTAAAVCNIPYLWLSAFLLTLTLYLTAIFFPRRARSPRALLLSRALALLTLASLAATWYDRRVHYTSPADLRHFVTADSQLARVTGTVLTMPAAQTPAGAELASFNFQPPGTTFILAADQLWQSDQPARAAGSLLIKVKGEDHRLWPGDRLDLTGWLQQIEGPSNPGEFDFHAWADSRGIFGRLTVERPDTWTTLPSYSPLSFCRRLKARLAESAHAALHRQLPYDPDRAWLLDALLLGRRERDADDLETAFRRTGLTHLLSVSGAHLGILMGLLWLLLRVVGLHPRHLALAMLLGLIAFFLIVPAQIPLVRAGLMAVMFCFAALGHRRPHRLDPLALAAVAALLWRPADISDVGFQLSYATVAGLLLFTPPLAQRWGASIPATQDSPNPATPVTTAQYLHHAARRWLITLLAANVAAFSVSLPLVAYHFQIISPFAILLGLAAMFPVAAILGLGFAKITVTYLLPSAGLLLAKPLTFTTDALIRLTQTTSHWPAVSLELPQTPSLLWLLVTLTAIAWWLSGIGHPRWNIRGFRGLCPAVVALCFLWLTVEPRLFAAAAFTAPTPSPPTLTLTSLDVGDGSCFLLSAPADNNRDTLHLLFDCGSQQYIDVGARSVVPALQALGVSQLDAIFISHADLDHYCGLLDVVKQFPVRRILTTPYLLAEAQADAAHDPPIESALSVVLQELQARHLTPTALTAGHQENWTSHLNLDVLWPPPDLPAKLTANDTSLVLRVHTPHHRILLTGDIQQFALTTLLSQQNDLHADVTDIPHHGSFVDASPAWLAAVHPTHLLQSSGKARLHTDRWAPLLTRYPQTTRLITAHTGMIRLFLHQDGRIESLTFRKQPAPPPTASLP